MTDDFIHWSSSTQLRDAVAEQLKDFPTFDSFHERFLDEFCQLLERTSCPLPSDAVCHEFYKIMEVLYNAEGFTRSLPPFSSALIDTMEGAHYRDELLALYRKTRSPDITLQALSGTFINCHLQFMRHLSPVGFTDIENASTTIPLIDTLDVRSAVQDLIASFPNDFEELALFSTIRTQLEKNQLEVSASAKKPVSPHDYKGTSHEVVHAFLKHTPLETLFAVPAAFAIPDETRFSGQWIVAPQGRGKTTLLHTMFLNDIEKDASIIVMDSKGDLINPIKKMAAIADRLILIEPDAQHPLALNPLDVPSDNVPHTIALIEYILSGLLEAKFTNLQSALFRHVLPAIMPAISHPTIEDLKEVLAAGLTPAQTAQLDARLRKFFEDRASGFYSKTYAETRSQIIWRLDFILTNDTMRAMFASPTTRLKIGDAMNTGKIILIDASKAILGDEGSEFYQRFFLALILAAAQQRAKLQPSEKMPVYVYLDECQWVRNDQKLATILDECRSQKIALILSHQRTEQIKDPNVLSAMSNCAIRFANSDDEAKYLAPKLRCEPEFLYSLPRGTFAAFVRDLTPHAVALKIPYVDIETLTRMTAQQQSAIRERMHTEYGIVSTSSSLHSPAASTSVLQSSENTASGLSLPAAETPSSVSDAPESGPTW